jgi:hypothetical protein
LSGVVYLEYQCFPLLVLHRQAGSFPHAIDAKESPFNSGVGAVVEPVYGSPGVLRREFMRIYAGFQIRQFFTRVVFQTIDLMGFVSGCAAPFRVFRGEPFLFNSSPRTQVLLALLHIRRSE